MEAYKNIPEVPERPDEPKRDLFDLYSLAKSKIMSYIGYVVAVIGVIVMFLIAAAEITKEINVSSGQGAKILQYWRETNGLSEGEFPEQRGEIIRFEGQEYFFVIDKIDKETGLIEKWHFAYDGKFNYVFQGFRFWVLFGFVFAISLWVAFVNYKSTVDKTKEKIMFQKSLIYYQRAKERVKEHTQYLPKFCFDKNRATYEMEEMRIVEEAGLKYRDWKDKKINFEELEKWQKKKLKKIRKIKMINLYASDLLQDGNLVTKKIRMLPKDQNNLQLGFMLRGAFQKSLMAFLSGLAIGFAVKITDWLMGVVYGFQILMSFVTAVATAVDHTNTILRARVIAKGDYLNEFYNVKEKYIERKEVADELQSERQEFTVFATEV